MRNLLIRGLLVGLLAGVFAFVVASTLGEPSVDAAIAYEDQRADAEPAPAGGVEEEPAVSRSAQKGVGLATGLLVYGATIGGIFALTFAFAYGRVGRLNARATALWLSAAGFVVLILVPFLKYPGSPPATSFDETIDRRTGLYFVMLAISVVMAGLAVWAARQVHKVRDGWTAVLTGVAIYIVAVGVEMALLPSINEVPRDFDPNVLWEFRQSALAMHLVIWATLGLVFGYLTERSVRRAAEQGANVPLQSAGVL